MDNSTEKNARVRCADCGLLALRVGRSVPAKLRASWEDPNAHHGVSGTTPQCVVEAFTPEDNKRLETNRMDETARVIQSERDCDKFFQLVPGRDPAWHQDQAMLAELQKRDDERREKDRLWMEQQKDADRKAREEDKDADRKYQEAQKASEREYQEAQKENDRRHQREQADRLADKAFRRQFITIMVSALFGSILTAVVGWLATKSVSDKKDLDAPIEKKAGLEK
jgi:hypothetical protein